MRKGGRNRLRKYKFLYFSHIPGMKGYGGIFYVLFIVSVVIFTGGRQEYLT